MAKNLLIQKAFINGKFIDAKNKINIINPANEKIIGTVPDLSGKQIQDSIKAANNAFKKWKSKSAIERSNILNKWHDLILENIDELALIMTKEQGKILSESKSEIKYAASFIKWFAEEAQRIYGTIIPSHIKDSKILVDKFPIGVCAIITPWNFPGAMITRKVAPALASGCTVIIKPAMETPFSAIAFAKLAQDAGIIDGAINIVTGDANLIGDELLTSNIVKKLSFTGSTKIGKLLMRKCADTVKNISLELGGNAPFIIFDDANIEAAVNGLMASKFRNSGQTCISANRIYLHEKIYDKFISILTEKVKKLNIGNGEKSNIDIGPLINEQAIIKINNLIEDAKAKNAKIIYQNNIKNLGNCFFPTTIIGNVTNDMKISKEEIFGPVIAIEKFNNLDNVIQNANNSNYGLAAYIYSQNLNTIIKCQEELEYGMIGINEVAISSSASPFGGIKESGIGIEGSYLGIDEYLHIKYTLLKN